jgi:hypothetical protein
MSSIAPLPHQAVDVSVSPRTNSVRYFYLSAATLLLIVLFLGFQRFYLHGQSARRGELTGPVKNLLIVHGIAMTAWVVLFFAQPLLIVGNRRRAHISLGIAGAILAACIVVLGPWTAIRTAQTMPDVVRHGIHLKPFLAIQFGAILNFGTCVAIGVWQRRRAEIHRPMMFLGTLAIMGAAAARIIWLRDLYAPTIWGDLFGPYFIPLVIGAGFLAAKTALTRSLDRWLAGGLAAVIVSDAIIMAIARSPGWERFVHSLLG